MTYHSLTVNVRVELLQLLLAPSVEVTTSIVGGEQATEVLLWILVQTCKHSTTIIISPCICTLVLWYKAVTS